MPPAGPAGPAAAGPGPAPPRAGRDETGQGGFLALADEPAVAVNHEPPAVTGQPPRLDHGLAEINGPPGLERIDMDRREAG